MKKLILILVLLLSILSSACSYQCIKDSAGLRCRQPTNQTPNPMPMPLGGQ